MGVSRDFGITCDDWFHQGKEDAWAGRPKQSSIEDPVAASLYDLGYSEGTHSKPPHPVEPG
jgi:hypothetical protein